LGLPSSEKLEIPAVMALRRRQRSHPTLEAHSITCSKNNPIKLGSLREVQMFLRSIIVILLSTSVLASAGNVNVTIKEWDTPSANTHPHDTEIAPDGSLWYTGQYANLLGRLDPASGKIQEYKLKTPDSGPHGLVADKDGNIWFTANNKAYIGKLD